MKSWLAEADYKTVMHILVEHAPQGMVTAPSLSEIKEHLDKTEAHGVIFGGVLCRDPGI